MAKALVIASLCWPLILAAGTAARVADTTPALSSLVYLAGSRICHQKPERSFHTHGAPWPVCGRCAGVYLGAPAGALAAWAGVRRRRPAGVTTSVGPSLGWVVAAGVPTAALFAIEHVGGAAVSTVARFAAALPLGAAVAWTIVRVAGESSPAHRIH